MKKAFILLASLMILVSCGDTINTAKEDNEQICGGYTEQREPTQEEIDMFRKATADQGMSLTPLSVATQVVAGLNYRFWCRFRKSDESGNCWVVIFKPLPGQGNPRVTSITPEK